MSATYSKRTCRCGKEVSLAGVAQHNHMMSHVRRGEAAATQPYRTERNNWDPRWEYKWLRAPAMKLPVNPVLNPRTHNP